MPPRPAPPRTLQGSNPMEHNGGAVLAMTGKNCVAIARCVDRGAAAVVGRRQL